MKPTSYSLIAVSPESFRMHRISVSRSAILIIVAAFLISFSITVGLLLAFPRVRVTDAARSCCQSRVREPALGTGNRRAIGSPPPSRSRGRGHANLPGTCTSHGRSPSSPSDDAGGMPSDPRRGRLGSVACAYQKTARSGGMSRSFAQSSSFSSSSPW